MGGIVDKVVNVASFGLLETDFGGEESGKAASQAISGAAGTAAKSQGEALEYLKEREKLPQQFREGALTKLGGLYGLEGGEGVQQDLISRAEASPLYKSLIGGLGPGEETISRVASAGGMSRSGSLSSDLAEFGTDLKNNALLTAYNQELQGLQGLASLPSNAAAIAQGTAGIGQTLAQGQIAGSQAKIQAQNIGMDQLMGVANLGMQAAGAFSDIRLKENIRLIGKAGDHNWYRWDWNKEAANLDLYGESQGVMAHEVYDIQPEIVGHRDGYITVNYQDIEYKEAASA